jgi:hypothetical protein
MEFDLVFLLSAIYLGIGVIIVSLGLFAVSSKEQKEVFEERLNDHPVQLSIITLMIMIMLLIGWLPYLVWSVIEDWNKTEEKNGI